LKERKRERGKEKILKERERQKRRESEKHIFEMRDEGSYESTWEYDVLPSS
jgi:hypothetical protein